MKANRVVEYTITGQAKNEDDPKRFLTLGILGRPQVEIKEKGWFLITGSIRDDVFENVENLQILQQSLREAITSCNCSRIKVKVSLRLS